MGSRAPVTTALIAVNVAMYLLQQLYERSMVFQLALWPWDTPLFKVWQLVTYAFLHGGAMHLFLNMFALYMFGPEIEALLGKQRFLIYYLVCVLGAAALHLVVGMMGSAETVGPTVGASGGVFGLLLAFGMAFPQRRLMLLFPPIPMPAWLFVTLYGLLELGLGITGAWQGVAHFAHLGGMVAGFILLMIWRRPQRGHYL